MPKTLCLRAFAKINNGLKILRKRPDGYHELRTIYQTIALHDRLEIGISKSGKGITVECDNTAIPSGPGNLVYRACEAWAKARGWRGRIQVEIAKMIPVGSGLGGASTDAAATILGLERLSGEPLNFLARQKLAAGLGSDVPLFFLGGRVLGCGRGEEVYPLSDLPSRHCLVIFPGFSVSTAEAYNQAGLRLTEQGGAAYISRFGAWPHFPLMSWGPAENDFEQVVFARWPELARLKRRLIRAGAEVASLTGSGSAVYALFSSSRQMARASKLIPKGWHLYPTHTLVRAEYHRRLFVQ
ncbi:MAG TPA: 4-(cytidine 5'-diphospho)-2-C-methyl-D-erythritol kinase [Terriglobia bacterium]|nr:4-(cytidine 5'-diphospho)-2-C-methyl-D-erythritol kinase [Terriglobia bacterium]